MTQDEALADPHNPVRQVALEACRAKDRCDALQDVVAVEGALLTTEKGRVIHPAWVEARQQANMLKQLVASMRLPDGATGKRPQRHLGAAGSRQPNGAGTAAVSSLERARLRAQRTS